MLTNPALNLSAGAFGGACFYHLTVQEHSSNVNVNIQQSWFGNGVDETGFQP